MTEKKIHRATKKKMEKEAAAAALNKPQELVAEKTSSEYLAEAYAKKQAEEVKQEPVTPAQSDPLAQAMAMMMNSQMQMTEVMNKMATSIEKLTEELKPKEFDEKAIEKERAERKLIHKSKFYLQYVKFVFGDGSVERDEIGVTFKTREEAEAYGMLHYKQPGKFRIYDKIMVSAPQKK